MVDDIQLLVIQDDEEDTHPEAAAPEPRESSLPNVGVREGLALLVGAGLLLIGIGVLGGPTGENASLLWLFGSFQLFSRSSDGEKTDTSESEATTTEVSLNEVEALETRETSREASTESPAITRNRPEMSVSETDGDREVASLVKTLMREGKQQPLPDASGLVAPIRRPLAATLEGIPQELTVLRRDVGPVLVGVAYNETTVSRLAEVYDTMLVVAPHYEDSLQEVLKYLPALIQTNGVNGLGSARTFTVPAPEPPGPEAESQATLKDLRGHKGEPLHPLARTEPDFLTISAPPEWTGPARSVLSDYAPVIDIIEWDAPEIHVAGFVFDSAIELPDHIIEQASTNAEDGTAKPEGNENPPSPGSFTSGSIDNSEQPETDGGEAQSRGGTGRADSTPTPESERRPESASQNPNSADGSSVPIPSENDEEDSDEGPNSDAHRSNDDEKAASSDTDKRQNRGAEGRSESSEKPEKGRTSASSTGDGPSGGKPTSNDPPDDSTESTAANPTHSPDDSQEQTSSQPSGIEPEDKRGGKNGREPSSPAFQPDEDNEPADENGSPTKETGDAGDQAQSSDRTDSSPADGPDNLPPADANVDFGTDAGDSNESSQGTANGMPADSTSGNSPPDDRPVNNGDNGSPDNGSAGAAPGEDREGTPTDGKGADSSEQAPSPPASGGPESRSGSERQTPGGANTGPVSGGSATPTGAPSGTSSTGSTGSSGPPNPPYDTDDGPGIVPFGEAPASSDPTVVDVTEHVLNELTFQATATPDREVYATVYADEDGLIRHHHAIDHPDFLKSRRDSITFTPGFFKHLRLLANLRKDIDHRLAGGAHSHPVSGRPKQSPADKQFAQKVWRNQRNTAFVIGVNEGSGPDEWTITDNGYEVQRQSNEYLVRIRAFAGTNESKQIRLHQDMGQ